MCEKDKDTPYLHYRDSTRDIILLKEGNYNNYKDNAQHKNIKIKAVKEYRDEGSNFKKP